jgi:hypothetical protein
MAFSDWTFNGNGTTSFHSADPYQPAGTIPAPTGGGSYCRIVQTSDYGSAIGFKPSSSVFQDVPYSPTPKAIRLQVMHYAPSYGSRIFHLAAKFTPSVADFADRSAGYCLCTNQNAVYLRTSTTPGASPSQILLTNSLANATWHSWRLTVYPVTSTTDRIIAERETSPGSGVWTSSWPNASGDVLRDSVNEPNQYIPWGGTNKSNGFFIVNTTGGAMNVRIDNLKVSLATVPVPL